MIKELFSFSNYLEINKLRSFKSLHKNPLFIIGLFLRIFLIIFLLPKAQQDWFIPFFKNNIQDFSLNPWLSSYTLNQNEIVNTASFPYGIVMYLAYLPFTLLGYFSDKFFNTYLFASIGLGLTSLFFDYFSLITISRLLKKYKTNLLLISYWLSPLSIFIIYVHGQIDIVPVFLLIFAIYSIKNFRPLIAGISFGFAISAKFSMAIALPLVFVYILKKNGFRKYFKSFAITTFFTLIICTVPWVFSESFMNMVLFPTEATRIFSVYFSYGEDLKVYLLPTAYFLVLYLIWRVNRITIDLFIIFIGIGFFSLLILLPPAPGWYLWVLPFLVFYQLKSEENYSLSLLPFSFFFLIYFFIYDKTASLILFKDLNLFDFFNQDLFKNKTIQSFLFTLLQGSGLIICIRMYIFGIVRNQYYQKSSKSLVLSVSNNNDRYRLFFLEILNNLYFTDRISYISEDSYRNFERNNLSLKPNLSLPDSSNLNKLCRDVFSLIDGKSIYNRKYSKESGKFISLNKINTSKNILIGSYSSKYPKRLSDRINLKILFDLDANLDIKFVNEIYKITYREKKENIQNITFKKNIENLDNFDIAFIIKLVNPNQSNNKKLKRKYPLVKLTVVMANGFFHEEMIKALIALCSVHIDLQKQDQFDKIKLTIDGDITSEDIDQISKILIPNQESLISYRPKWQNGMLGIVQLILLVHISEYLHR